MEEMRALIEEEPDSLERSSLKEAVPLIQVRLRLTIPTQHT